MLLFENFNFLFHVIIDWLFLTCVFATLAIQHNARVRSVWKSCLYILNINLFFSFQVLQRLRYNIPGLVLDILCPTGDQEVAGSTTPRSATFFRGD